MEAGGTNDRGQSADATGGAIPDGLGMKHQTAFCIPGVA